AHQIRAWNADIARAFRTTAVKYRIIGAEQFLNGFVDADIDVAEESNALAFHLLDATVDEVLLHLEVGDTETQQPTRFALTLIDMHVVAGATELLRRRHSGRTRSDDRDFPAGFAGHRLRHDKAHFIGLVGQRLLHRLDGDRRVLEIERTSFLARRRAD